MKKLAAVILLMLPLLADAQLIKTSLTLTVRDELGNTVEKATVTIYENEADYTAEKNPAATGLTDAKGVIKFKELKSIAYFVIARKDDKDNAGAGERIGKLDANKINKVTIIIQ